MTRDYVWLDALPVAVIDTRPAPGKASSSGKTTTINYIIADHLNTPRVLTDAQGKPIWRWPWQGNPFGEHKPESLDGHMVFNLRFPGQYFDAETGWLYNYFRYYDPTTGRYLQSDPIGLAGGINTYAYVGNNPLSKTDPFGLKTYRCTKPLDWSVENLGKKATGFFYQIPWPHLYHQYSCIVRNGKTICGGKTHISGGYNVVDLWNGVPGKRSHDSMDKGDCMETQPDNKCFEQCLSNEWAKPRQEYKLSGNNCQDYDNDVNAHCRKQCSIQ